MLLISMKTDIAHAQDKLELSFEGQIGSLQPTESSYLGTQIGAGPNIFNFVQAGNRLDLKSAGLHFGYQVHEDPLLQYFTGLKITGGFDAGRADQGQAFDTLDPAGNNLLIPGVGVGPNGAGFFLPGPNNQITEGQYDTDFDYFKFMLGVESDFKTNHDALTVTPSFSVGYGKSITRNMFSGNVPFFMRRFSYDTKTEVKTISPTVGLNLAYKVNPVFHVFSGLKYAYDFNSGSGTDSLSFTGFNQQTARLSNDENTPNYGLTMGMNIKLKPNITLTLQGNHQRLGNVPVVNVRDGDNISDFSYEDADIYSGSIRTIFKF